MAERFFVDHKPTISAAAIALQDFSGSKEDVDKALQVAEILKFIAANPETFDQNCQVTIGWIGPHIVGSLVNIADDDVTPGRIEDVFGSVYRLVVELDLSRRSDSFELLQFTNYTRDNFKNFGERLQSVIEYARQEMPINVIKHLLNTDAILNLRKIEPFTKVVNDRFVEWEDRLFNEEAKASVLSESLKRYENAFNFVGLYQGFDEMATEKVKEAKKLRFWTSAFGVLAVAPLFVEMILLYINIDRLELLSWHFAVSAIPVISLTLLMLYFFRIVLRRSEACKTQLLQLELRKTLCRFIQDYVGYAESIKKSNPESLSKFENVVFSNLLSSEEKLPTTFDGVEQLAQLVKAVRGG